MRMFAIAALTLGLAGATAVINPSPSVAQGFSFGGPGFEIGVGRPWYGDPYYYQPYGAYAYRPYYYGRRYYNGRAYGWDPGWPSKRWDPYGKRWDGGN
jgi:hypothetical protein